jgi:hypothetical protein
MPTSEGSFDGDLFRQMLQANEIPLLESSSQGPLPLHPHPFLGKILTSEQEFLAVYSSHQEELNALRLYERETEALYQMFKSIDKKGIGWIQIKSLFDLIEIEESNFTRTVFSVFDKENTGYICFRDFFVIVWNICTMAVVPLGLSCPPAFSISPDLPSGISLLVVR